VQPWFIEINSWGITETLAALFIFSAIYFYLKGNPAYTTVSIVLSMLTRYEGWVLASMFLLAAVVERRWSNKEYMLYPVSCLSIMVSWSLWSYVNTSDFMARYNAISSFFRLSPHSSATTLRLLYQFCQWGGKEDGYREDS